MKRQGKLKNVLELNFKQGEKVKLSPVGEVTGLDGRMFRIDGEALVASISANDIHIPLDENHSFDEAVGWFDKTSFELREDGIYASLELNTKGVELSEDRRYRYLSPVYEMGQNSVVVGLDSVGFVNRPNLLNQEINTKEKEKEPMTPEEKEALKAEILAELKKEATPPAPETPETEQNSKAMLDDIKAIKEALMATNKKLSLLGQPTELEANAQTVLTENDKKVVAMLGITPESYLKTKKGN